MSSRLRKVTLCTADRVHSIQYAPRLGAIITRHVDAGQANNFVHPYTASETVHLFTRNAQAIATGHGPGGVVMWVARLQPHETPLESLDKDGNPTSDADIVGSVQLAFHIAPNGRFRSEVRKLIVDDRYYRRGIGRTLMMELEKEAKANGSTLCVSCHDVTGHPAH